MRININEKKVFRRGEETPVREVRAERSAEETGNEEARGAERGGGVRRVFGACCNDERDKDLARAELATMTGTEQGRNRRHHHHHSSKSDDDEDENEEDGEDEGSLDLSGNDDEEENESDEKQQQTQDDLYSSEKRLEELSTALRRDTRKISIEKGKIYETAMMRALIVTSKSSEQRTRRVRTSGAKWERSRHSVGDVDEVGVG